MVIRHTAASTHTAASARVVLPRLCLAPDVHVPKFVHADPLPLEERPRHACRQAGQRAAAAHAVATGRERSCRSLVCFSNCLRRQGQSASAADRVGTIAERLQEAQQAARSTGVRQPLAAAVPPDAAAPADRCGSPPVALNNSVRPPRDRWKATSSVGTPTGRVRASVLLGGAP